MNKKGCGDIEQKTTPRNVKTRFMKRKEKDLVAKILVLWR